ncbi:fructosamine kinase family protein [Parvicella tangerina]|uniref:Ketoamine kinase n=1 Tax=Parvicella tangerina TaxID=2829795 RepID=A0A916NGN5_9FLAO|nr:fructosamine kinase family protein [Parvicella tangerina]CAG5080904.1 putative ketoamine kinase [Parvicella tangerina]
MWENKLKHSVEEELSEIKQTRVEILDVQNVHGGDINYAYQLDTNTGKYFIKVNKGLVFPKMFQQESLGLNFIKKSNTFETPKVITYKEGSDKAYLLLEWIQPGGPTPTFWEDFGRKLARMHACSSSYFGWESDNYIGSLKQYNRRTKNWSDFFVLQRLEPQLKMAVEKKIMKPEEVKSFEKLFAQLEKLFPVEPPALLHGDLWSGNYMVSSKGSPIIMDPAVYFGHREMDLAMTRLFGGFGEEMYRSYHEHFPLESEWEQRVDLCNLYPLLVHVNLFGRGYLSKVKEVLKHFS